MKLKFTQKLIREDLEKRSGKVTDADAQGLSSDAKKQKTANKKADRINLRDEVQLLLDFIRDYAAGRYTKVPWKVVASMTAAIIYLISPLDLVPDIIPVFGLLDDAAMLALVIASFRDELETYRKWKYPSIEDRFVEVFQ